MTLEEAVRDFRVSTEDTVKPYLWKDDDLLPWFAEAEEEAAIRGKLIHDTDEFQVSAGETKIDLPAGLFDIQFAELVDASGQRFEITGATRRDLDKFRPGWRSRTERPICYIHDDKSLMLSAIPDMDYTLYVEFYRTPANRISSFSSKFEISEIHHGHLVDWVKHKAYGKPDADTFDPGRSAAAEAEFTRYFGRRPDASLRRKQGANRPHRNGVHL